MSKLVTLLWPGDQEAVRLDGQPPKDKSVAEFKPFSKTSLAGHLVTLILTSPIEIPHRLDNLKIDESYTG